MPNAVAAAVTSKQLPRGTLDRQAIVEAAMGVVEHHGADGLTVPEVARRPGVGRTAVCWHFSRRDDLLRAVDEVGVARFDALFPEPITGDWHEQVRDYWTRYRSILRRSPVPG